MATDTERLAKPEKDEAPPGLDDALSPNEARRFRNLRRIGIAAIAAIVILASIGALGQKTHTVTATGGGYTLTVTYPSVVRPGLDVRFEISVSNPSGFGKSLTLGFKRHYFDIFDLNSGRPDADNSWSDAFTIFYSWNSLQGTSFHFSLDMYAEYGEHFGVDGATSVIVGTRPVTTATYHTRWVP